MRVREEAKYLLARYFAGHGLTFGMLCNVDPKRRLSMTSKEKADEGSSPPFQFFKWVTKEFAVNIIKLLSKLGDLLAAVYSVDVIVNQRQQHLAKKSQKEKSMHLKNVLMFFVLASSSLFATSRAQDIPEVVFTATTEKATGPATIEAGYINLVLENQDEGMRALGIFRVKDGADVAGAKALVVRNFNGEEVSQEEEKSFTDGFYGGAVFVEPGARKEVGVTVIPGTYVVYLDGITDEGINVTPEFITTLEVTPSSASVEAPTPDYTIKMVDHAFAFPADMKAGKHLFRVENIGHQEHMMFISKMLPGKTFADVQALLEDPTLDSTTVMEEETFGVHGISPEAFNDVEFELEPGNYAAVCFVTDPETGAPHAFLGMTQVFTVTE